MGAKSFGDPCRIKKARYVTKELSLVLNFRQLSQWMRDKKYQYIWISREIYSYALSIERIMDWIINWSGKDILDIYS